MTRPTPREVADACCDCCRALPGIGPWCGRCGREMRRRKYGDEGTAFTQPCTQCDAELAVDAEMEHWERPVVDVRPL